MRGKEKIAHFCNFRYTDRNNVELSGGKYMAQKLYLECYSGISGDMTVAALLDLGADAHKLEHALESLHLDGYSIAISRVKKSGLDACDFSVNLDKDHENHDHDMAYLHGHEHIHAHTHEHEHEHSHEHEHEHTHEHSHDHSHEHHHGHHHHHEHRGLPEILDIISASDMTEHAKEIATRIFDILAEAESKAHGVPLDEVHFHEVGAVDSIVDIAAVAVCLDDLGIEEVIVPVLYEGCGYVRCQHGVIPVPVPATLNIVSAHGIVLHQTDTFGEFVTPTGAAIVAAITTDTELPARYTVEKIGLGAGKREYERPSLLRAMLITSADVKKNFTDEIVKLECNIDDCSGEAIGYAMERLLEAGARDVSYTPIFMKKNRPAYMITVLCTPDDTERMEQILFMETTTIGIRKSVMERTILGRKNIKAPTSFGEVDVKVLTLDGEIRYLPEYESVKAIAIKKGISFIQTYKTIEQEVKTVWQIK